MSVSKKPTRSPTGMPFTRKSEIFGLHSIPVGTNPSVLEKPLIQRFFAYKVFFRRTCQRKNEKCGVNAAKIKLGVYRQTERRLYSRLFFLFRALRVKKSVILLKNGSPHALRRSRLPARSVLLLRRGVHRTPTPQ